VHKKYNPKKPNLLNLFRFKCYSCGKVGHRAAECSSKPIKNQTDNMYINIANYLNSDFINSGKTSDPGDCRRIKAQTGK